MAQVILKEVRLAFPHLFVPQESTTGDGAPKYNGAFIIEPGSANAKAMAAAVRQVAKDKWADKAQALFAELVKKDKVCYRESEKTNPSGEVYDGFEGCYYVQASDAAKPTVVDRDRTQLDSTSGRPYAGCYVNVVLDIWPQDNKYGKRINAALKAVQFVKDGDAFGGSAPVAPDVFDDLGDGADDVGFTSDDEFV